MRLMNNASAGSGSGEKTVGREAIAVIYQGRKPDIRTGERPASR